MANVPPIIPKFAHRFLLGRGGWENLNKFTHPNHSFSLMPSIHFFLIHHRFFFRAFIFHHCSSWFHDGYVNIENLPGSFIASLGILWGGSSVLGSGSWGSGSGRKGLHRIQIKPLSMALSVSSSVYKLLQRACSHLKEQEKTSHLKNTISSTYVCMLVCFTSPLSSVYGKILSVERQEGINSM